MSHFAFACIGLHSFQGYSYLRKGLSSSTTVDFIVYGSDESWKTPDFLHVSCSTERDMYLLVSHKFSRGPLVAPSDKPYSEVTCMNM